MKQTFISRNKGVITFWLSVTLAVIVVTLLSSCGTRKVVIDEVKKDSLSQISVKIATKEVVNIKKEADIFIEELVITPLDTCKDIVVNGVTYKNAVLRYKKTKDKTIYTEKKIVSENELKVQDTKVTQNRKVKDIERTSNPYWLLLIPIGLYLIYKYLCFIYPPLKNIL